MQQYAMYACNVKICLTKEMLGGRGMHVCRLDVGLRLYVENQVVLQSARYMWFRSGHTCTSYAAYVRVSDENCIR